jgi:membrane protease YdiL (CAAX protease family)
MGVLIGFARALPRWVEMMLVVMLGFGLFIYSALSEAMAPTSVPPAAGDFLSLSSYEIVIGTLLLALLFLRGWRLSDLGLVQTSVWEPMHALVLLATIVVGSQLIWSIAASVGGDDQSAAASSVSPAGIGVVTAIVFSLINALYEEIFVCAYIVAALRSGGLGVATATLVSATLRLSYHVYQGPEAFLLIGPFGLLMGWYFATRGRLLPLIVVHFALDMLAFLPYLRF